MRRGPCAGLGYISAICAQVWTELVQLLGEEAQSYIAALYGD